MVVGINRSTQLNVNLNYLQHNVQEFKNFSGKKVWAVVKADGYGCGILEVSRACLQAGAEGLCVAILDEAIFLREKGLNCPILVLGITDVEEYELARKYNISITVGDVQSLRDYSEKNNIDNINQPLHVHIACDTGMNRIGFKNVVEINKAIEFITNSNLFDFEGIFTHFATADEINNEYFKLQNNDWKHILKSIIKKPKYIHCANTATTLWHKDDVLGNSVRIGIGLYGLNPSNGVKSLPIELKPVASLTSNLIFVKKLSTGMKVSYGATYELKNDDWIGTLPIGYADGYPRSMQGFKVLINGKFCEIVGRVCMDQLMIKLPNKLKVGTKVTLIGKEENKEITFEDVAKYLNTINYEILVDIGNRVKRTYIFK
ncbi:MAG: alanine racemase [Firmicutes bacterium]|uniref:Alanine racemase n=1 Tax=Candidatus Gallilactobacillus intestinavium TaxID=2840838 RepID=A0A9D9H8H0_9LACO|nr:alanine racemase [Candidatus Gallilactobacillus intestinavium]